MPHLDWTINVSNILALGGTVWAVIQYMRVNRIKRAQETAQLTQAVRDVERTLGERYPPTGVVGDVEMLKRLTMRHNDWLIELNAELGSPLRMERT